MVAWSVWSQPDRQEVWTPTPLQPVQRGCGGGGGLHFPSSRFLLPKCLHLSVFFAHPPLLPCPVASARVLYSIALLAPPAHPTVSVPTSISTRLCGHRGQGGICVPVWDSVAPCVPCVLEWAGGPIIGTAPPWRVACVAGSLGVCGIRFLLSRTSRAMGGGGKPNRLPPLPFCLSPPPPPPSLCPIFHVSYHSLSACIFLPP